MSSAPPNAPSLSIEEILSDVPDGVTIGVNVFAAIKKMPPKDERKFVDLAPVLGLTTDGNVYAILALIDKIDAQSKTP